MVEKKDTPRLSEAQDQFLSLSSPRSFMTEKARWDGVTPIQHANPLFRWRDKVRRGARGAILGLFLPPAPRATPITQTRSKTPKYEVKIRSDTEVERSDSEVTLVVVFT